MSSVPCSSSFSLSFFLTESFPDLKQPPLPCYYSHAVISPGLYLSWYLPSQKSFCSRPRMVAHDGGEFVLFVYNRAWHTGASTILMNGRTNRYIGIKMYLRDRTERFSQNNFWVGGYYSLTKRHDSSIILFMYLPSPHLERAANGGTFPTTVWMQRANWEICHQQISWKGTVSILLDRPKDH